MEWIVLSIAVVALAGIVLVGVRSRRASKARLASAPADYWKTAQNAASSEATRIANATADGRPPGII